MESVKRQYSRRAIQLTFALAATSLLVSCSTKDPSANVVNEIPVAARGATLDVSTETITWPLDRYALSVAEMDTVYYAQDLLTRNCARAKGVDLPVVPRGLSVPATNPRGTVLGGGERNRTWGPWNPEWAAKWGEKQPPPSAQSQALMELNSSPTEREDVRAACFAADDVQSLQEGLDEAMAQDTVVGRAFGTAVGQAEKDSRSLKAAADWAQCMNQGGVPIKGDGLGVFFETGGEELSEEDGIARALIDTGCKEKVSLVQRMADIEAAYQLQYIEKHQSALTAERAKTDEIVNRAKAIAERG